MTSVEAPGDEHKQEIIAPEGTVERPQTFQLPFVAEIVEHASQFHEIEKLFSAYGMCVITGAATGMGDIGKTQLAASYAHAAADNVQRFGYSCIVWFRAEHLHELNAQFILTAKKFCGIVATSPNEARDAVWRFFDTRNRVLVVFDNLLDLNSLDMFLRPTDFELEELHSSEDIRNVRNFRNRIGNSVHVLVTTRDFQYSVEWGTVIVDRLSRGESLEFVRTRIHQAPGAFLNELVRIFNGIPLALALAAAYLRFTGASLKIFVADFAAEHSRFAHDPSFANTPDYVVVTTVLSMILTQLQKMEVYKETLQILCCATLLRADSLPRNALMEGAGCSEDRFGKACRQLLVLGLISVGSHDEPQMHRLIQGLLRHPFLLPPDCVRVSAHRLARYLKRNLTDTETASSSVDTAWGFVSVRNENVASADVAMVAFELARFLSAQPRYVSEVLRMVKYCLKYHICVKASLPEMQLPQLAETALNLLFDENNVILCALLHLLADCYYHCHVDHVSLLEKLLAAQQFHNGSGSREAMHTLTKLARAYQINGDTSKERTILSVVLSHHENQYQREVGQILEALAQTYVDDVDSIKRLRLATHALSLTQRYVGPERLEMVRPLLAVSSALKQSQNVLEQRRVLKMAAHVQSVNNDPHEAITLCLLAASYGASELDHQRELLDRAYSKATVQIWNEFHLVLKNCLGEAHSSGHHEQVSLFKAILARWPRVHTDSALPVLPKLYLPASSTVFDECRPYMYTIASSAQNVSTFERAELQAKIAAAQEDFRIANEFVSHRRQLASCDENSFLGRGGFGVVCEGEFFGQRAAVKIVQCHNKKETERFQRECYALAKLRQSNLVQFFGHETKDLNNGCSKNFIFMELLVPLNKHEPQINHWPVTVALHLGFGLQYLVSQGIFHGDLKQNNVLYDPLADTYKICDFGVARLEDESNRSTTIAATITHCAPEYRDCMLLRVRQLPSNLDTEKVDVFALGVTIMEILRGPLRISDDGTVLTSPASMQAYHLNLLPDSEAKELIRKCLHENPMGRPVATMFIQAVQRITEPEEIAKFVPMNDRWRLT